MPMNKLQGLRQQTVSSLDKTEQLFSLFENSLVDSSSAVAKNETSNGGDVQMEGLNFLDLKAALDNFEVVVKSRSRSKDS